MSMIEKQIEELETIATCLEEDTEIDMVIMDFQDMWSKSIRNAIDTIQKLSTKLSLINLENGWIPCDERLLEYEYSGRELMETEFLCQTYKGQKVLYRQICSDNTYIWFDGFDSFEVLSWQPLPQPYKNNI